LLHARRIPITEEAERQLRALSAREQRLVESGIVNRLQDQPARPSKAVKRLRPNPFAAFELRLGNLRALDNVDEANQEVVILLVGQKAGNRLIGEGEEFLDRKIIPLHGLQAGPEGYLRRVSDSVGGDCRRVAR
jgi:mRNA-degrading endonuclease RelE of RelBE toxin-antitoxin system